MTIIHLKKRHPALKKDTVSNFKRALRTLYALLGRRPTQIHYIISQEPCLPFSVLIPATTMTT